MILISVSTILMAFVLVGTIGFCLSIYLLIEVKAMKNSTHQVQFVPALEGVKTDNEGFEEITEKTRELFEQDDLDLDPLYDDGTAEALRPKSLNKKAMTL